MRVQQVHVQQNAKETISTCVGVYVRHACVCLLVCVRVCARAHVLDADCATRGDASDEGIKAIPFCSKREGELSNSPRCNKVLTCARALTS